MLIKSLRNWNKELFNRDVHVLPWILTQTKKFRWNLPLSLKLIIIIIFWIHHGGCRAAQPMRSDAEIATAAVPETQSLLPADTPRCYEVGLLVSSRLGWAESSPGVDAQLEGHITSNGVLSNNVWKNQQQRFVFTTLSVPPLLKPSQSSNTHYYDPE